HVLHELRIHTTDLRKPFPVAHVRGVRQEQMHGLGVHVLWCHVRPLGRSPQTTPLRPTPSPNPHEILLQVHLLNQALDLVGENDPVTLHVGVPQELVEDQLDRKSTRLNSSHVKISYAVFCLKKKSQPQSTDSR